MSGPEVVQEVNAIAASTWDSKVANIKRLLDDNGYTGMFSMAHVANQLAITFAQYDPINNVNVVLKVFNIDLSKDATERQILVVVDDYFGQFEGDRSYDWEKDSGANL